MRFTESKTTIEYPESDGQPMGETELHIRWIIRVRDILIQYFRQYPSAYVGADLLVYYEAGNPRKFLVPDVFVVPGSTQDPPRRTFKIWEEDGLPSVVIEIVSQSTLDRDLGEKRELYASLGVREYFLFDPEANCLVPPLAGFELRDGVLQEKPSVDGGYTSEELGCYFRVQGGDLQLVDSASHQPWLTAAEWHRQVSERERLAKERECAAKERERAEKELERAAKEHECTEKERERALRMSLEAELERLKAEIAKSKEK